MSREHTQTHVSLASSAAQDVANATERAEQLSRAPSTQPVAIRRKAQVLTRPVVAFDPVHGVRRSLYALNVDVGEGVSLLMHQPTGAVDELPSDLASSVVTAPELLPPEAVEYFVARGYLTRLTEAEEEAEFAELVQRVEDDHMSQFSAPLFSFITAYSCNLSCSYCFQANTGVRASDTRTMTVEAARQFLKVVEQSPKHPDRSVIELFGGEPLLPKLREVVELIVLSVEKMSYRVRATTNGTGLNTYLDLLGPTRISELQVSLDGPREVHDSRRVGLSKKPTFDLIWHGVREAVSRGTKVLIRANLDRRNFEAFPALVEFIADEGLLGCSLLEIHYINVRSDPVAPDFGGGHEMRLDEIEAYLANETQRHPFLAQIAAPHEIGTFNDWLSKNFQNPSTRHCGAVTNNVYFSPDGLVYSCHETAGRPEFAIGEVIDGQLLYNRTAQRWRSRRVDNIAACRRCPHALTCSGGCAARTDILNEPHQSYCDGFDAKFRAVLQRQYRASKSSESHTGGEVNHEQHKRR